VQATYIVSAVVLTKFLVQVICDLLMHVHLFKKFSGYGMMSVSFQLKIVILTFIVITYL